MVEQVIEPMELAHLPYKKGKTYEDYVGDAGLKRMGKKKWRHHVEKVVDLLKSAVQADDVVIGGGNARLIKKFSTGTRLGLNVNAFKGGFRLWEKPYDDFNHHRFTH
jgi:polyphosphate glucokinase